MAARTWIAVALSLAVWFAYMKWFAPPPPTPGPKIETRESGQPVTEKPAENTTQQKTKVAGGSSPFDISFGKASETVKRNDKMEVAFSENGGKIDSVKLLSYHESIKDGSDYIAPVTPSQNALALSTLFTDETLSSFSNGAYQLQASGENGVRYARSHGGTQVTKQYDLAQKGYLINSTIIVNFPNAARKDWGYLLIPVGGRVYEYDYNVPMKAWEIVADINDSVSREKYDKISETEQVLQGNTKWLAFGNRYFSTVVLSESEINPDVIFSKKADFIGGYLRYPLVLKDGNPSVKLKVGFYVGPKDVDHLNQIPGLKKLIDFGMFSVLAYPLLTLMKLFYALIHNWGVAIILLTILVRLVFYPLSLKSYRSMKAMQKLQPQIKALKEKYKDDMQRFNQEQMALFKAHKVNPMSGCLPILVQIPVFFALYSVLSNSIELFHAPFFGWIHDLSAKDPFYIYPVLMGISMFVQQKMTPTAGMDPMQAKIMLFMPILFTFIMLNLPSGLTVYIFLSTLLGIAQQWVINREPASVPAKTAMVKNAGT